MKARIGILATLLIASLTFADNGGCWSLDGKDDKSRPDIVCKELTEAFILSFRGDTREEVARKMTSKGIETDSNTIHYLSYAKRYNGDINFIFVNGKVEVITAIVGDKNYQLTWNGQYNYFCSDFPESNKKCD